MIQTEKILPSQNGTKYENKMHSVVVFSHSCLDCRTRKETAATHQVQTPTDKQSLT